MAHSSRFSYSVTPEACIAAAVILLTVPLPWVLAWLIAAAVHEISHCLMLILCGKSIERISIGLHGAKIQTQMLTNGETVLCALAGSAGGLLLLLARHFPRLAICALLQSMFNLLPVFPLDGGRALRGLVYLLFPKWLGDRISFLIEMIVLGTLILIGFMGTFIWKLGIIPLLFVLFFLLHTGKIKIPCK